MTTIFAEHIHVHHTYLCTNRTITSCYFMNYICFISGNTFISVFLHRLPLPCRSFADHQMTNIGCLLGRFNFTSFNLLYNSVAIILNFCLCTIFMTTTTITTNCYWWCCLLSVPLPLPLHTTVGISFALLPS